MKLLGVYNYTVILTYVGMLCSFAGIHFVFSNSEKSFVLALLCLMISGIMDMFDGKVASTKKNRTDSEKLFGIQIDSMADIISYGVFPSLIVYSLALGDIHYPVEHPIQAKVAVCICALYLLSALIRLSFFNVDEMQRQAKTTESRHQYRGLPVTSVAVIMPLLFIIAYFSKSARPPVLPCLILLTILGILFISPFKMPKPGKIGKAVLIVIGLVEFTLVILGKAYHVPTYDDDPSLIFENAVILEEKNQDLLWNESIQLNEFIPED